MSTPGKRAADRSPPPDTARTAIRGGVIVVVAGLGAIVTLVLAGHSPDPIVAFLSGSLPATVTNLLVAIEQRRQRELLGRVEGYTGRTYRAVEHELGPLDHDDRSLAAR